MARRPGPRHQRAALAGLAALVLLLAAVPLARAFPLEGGYGFDWLHPQTSRCHPITAAEAARFGACVFHPRGNAFGIPSAYHSCRASDRRELLVYGSAAQCRLAFETMQANGP